MGRQLQFELNCQPSRDGEAVRLWILFPEPGRHLCANRLTLYIDNISGQPVFGSRDIVLLRRAEGLYDLLGPNHLSVAARTMIGRHLGPWLDLVLTSPTRLAGVRDVLAVSPSQPKSRGSGISSAATWLEHALLTLSQWQPGGPVVDLLSACREVSHSLKGDVHSGLRAISLRMEAYLYRLLYVETADANFANAAISSYEEAARCFARIGLINHYRTVLASNDRLISGSDQLPLPGLGDGLPIAASRHEGLLVSRLNGFYVAIDDASPWSAFLPGRNFGCYTSYGSVEFSDQRSLQLLGNTQCENRRVVAVASKSDGIINFTAGLADELRVTLADPERELSCDGVSAVRIECDTLEFEPRNIVFGPVGAVTFSARGEKKLPHAVEILIAMKNSDNLRLRFILPRSMRTKSIFF